MGMKFRYEPDPYHHRLTSRNDVELRYHDSIILYKGEPHLVSLGGRSSDDWTKVVLIPFDDNYNYDTSKAVNINILTDKDISTDFSFGWVNTSVSRGSQLPYATYLERLPTRRYKQGVTAQNVLGAYPTFDPAHQSVMWSHQAPSQTMLGQCLSKRPSNHIPTTKMSPPELIEYIVNKVALADKTTAGSELSKAIVALTKRVALIYRRPPTSKKKTKKVDDLQFSILLDKQDIGIFTPKIMNVELHKPGLYSIVQDELIRASLIA